MLPMMGWRNEPGKDKSCYFVIIMDYNYLVFIYFSTIVFPGILMAFFYGHIYTVVLKQLRQIAAQEPQSEAGSVCTQHGGSQRQRSHFISRSQSRSHSEVNRCDSRRCSTSTNIVHQLEIQKTSKLWSPKSFTRRCLHPLDFFQHTSLRHIGPASPSDEGTSLHTTSPSCQNLLHSNCRHHLHHHQTTRHHSSLSDLQEESLHHCLLRHNYEGALKKSAEELRSKKKVVANEKPAVRKEESKNPQDMVIDNPDVMKNIKGLSRFEEPSNNQCKKEEQQQQHEQEDGEEDDICAMTPMIRISKVTSEAERLDTSADDLNSTRSCKKEKLCKRFLGDRMFERSSKTKDHNSLRSPRRSEDAGSRRGSTLSYVLYQVTHANKREVKAAKSLSIIVLFFLICWFPLYTINCVQAFCASCNVPPELMFFTIILTHVNSAVNPFLYAYHMKDFRLALKRFILEQILRQKRQCDPLSHRSLVSAHHSTLYRVAVGGGSPQLANVNTPHTHNTPIPSSASPVAGTPSGIRSRTSTLGSYGHWFQSKGVSSSVSLEKTPEDRNELPTRPRAATITSHTSPASVHSTGEGACLKKPLLSASNLLTSTNDSEQLTVSSPSDAIIINFGAADPTEVVFSINENSDGISTITDDSVNQKVGVIPSCHLNDSKLPPGNSTLLPDASENPAILITDSSLKFTNKNASSLTESVELSSASGGGETSIYLKNVTCHYEGLYDIGRNTRSFNYDSQTPSGLAKYLSDQDMCDSELGNTDDDKKQSEPKLSENCLIHENKPNGTDNSLKSSSGKRLAASEANMSQIPNGTDDITSSSSSKYESINNSDVLNKRKESEIGSLEATPNQSRTQEGTDESSPLTQEFYKYLPKMLRKKDENKKSRSTRTSKGWFSSMIRNRSYHGLSVEVVGSKQLPRANSISGAMDT